MSFYQAMRGVLILAPMMLVFWIGTRVKVWQIQLHINEMPNATRQLFQYRIGSYLCLLMFLVALIPWISLIFAVRFDWNRNDVSQIEILQFPSPYPQSNPEQIVIVKDRQDLSRLFDALEKMKPYTSSHEQAVGKSYILRLRRRSDGQWSNYEIAIYPDREAAGGLYMTGIYVTLINYNRFWGNLGGDHQAPDLGRFVEQLIRNRGFKKHDAK